MQNIARPLKRITPKHSKKIALYFGQARTIKESPKQSGKINSIRKDFSRRALPPGKRISKFGKIYWENRINRSDINEI